MTIEMKHKDTNDIISVDLGTDNSLARKAINEKELLGYYDMTIQEIQDSTFCFEEFYKSGSEVKSYIVGNI